MRGVADTDTDTEGGSNGNNAARHVKESRVGFGETETRDESGGVGCDDTTGDGDLRGIIHLGTGTGTKREGGTYEDTEYHHEPDLDVKDDLLDVGPLEVVILNTGLVDGDMVEQGGLLGFCEPFRLHGRIRQDEEGCGADDASDDAQDDKHDLPSSESGVINMLESIRDEPSDDLTYA